MRTHQLKTWREVEVNRETGKRLSEGGSILNPRGFRGRILRYRGLRMEVR